jgi:hypothetical protein
MNTTFQSNEEIFQFGRRLRDDLRTAKRDHAAERLTEVVECAYTTASEALGEMMESLLSVRDEVGEALPHHATKLDEAVASIRGAFERANNPNR